MSGNLDDVRMTTGGAAGACGACDPACGENTRAGMFLNSMHGVYASRLNPRRKNSCVIGALAAEWRGTSPTLPPELSFWRSSVSSMKNLVNSCAGRCSLTTVTFLSSPSFSSFSPASTSSCSSAATTVRGLADFAFLFWAGSAASGARKWVAIARSSANDEAAGAGAGCGAAAGGGGGASSSSAVGWAARFALLGGEPPSAATGTRETGVARRRWRWTRVRDAGESRAMAEARLAEDSGELGKNGSFRGANGSPNPPPAPGNPLLYIS
mmetsp:Transcript_22466/g.55413  ORF Transcript_22466/g.55413 Transcript_22466/m.55413 type:complete len:268 (-) Transcript_22466:76-879(-)